MAVASPMDVRAAQDARTLHRSKISHQEDKLSRLSQAGLDIHPSSLFSNTGVMAALAVMANMAVYCPNFDIEYLYNQSEFRHGVKTHILHSSSGSRIDVDQHRRPPWCYHVSRLLRLTQFYQFLNKAVTFDQGL